jgi:hypothetical protein
MSVPVLKLNLAPRPTPWRQYHQPLGWASLLVGAGALAAVCTLSFLAYREAARAGKAVVNSTEEAREVVRKQLAIQTRLQSIDVEKELPVWRLAERILGERSLPWSRLTAELERSMVQDVRLKSLQRTRNTAQAVELKIRGEAKSRAAEEAFVAELQKNAFFTQVILEREADRPGGGVEFEYTLPVSAAPPAYAPLPKFGPPRAVPALTPKPLPQPLPKPGPVARTVPSPTAAPPLVVAPPPPATVPVRPIQRPPSRGGAGIFDTTGADSAAERP